MKHIIILVALFISGCASSALSIRAKDLAASKIAYDQAVTCCESYSDMVFEPLNEKGKNKFVVGHQFQAFDFPEGKSFFRAVALPKLNYLYSLNIETWQTDSAGFASSLLSVHYFEPTLLFLDENFEVVEKFADLRFRYGSWFSTSGWETDIDIGPALADARYLIVYTNPEVVGSVNVASGGSMTMMAGGTYVSVPVSDQGIPANYEGIINIEIDKL